MLLAAPPSLLQALAGAHFGTSPSAREAFLRQVLRRPCPRPPPPTCYNERSYSNASATLASRHLVHPLHVLFQAGALILSSKSGRSRPSSPAARPARRPHHPRGHTRQLANRVRLRDSGLYVASRPSTCIMSVCVASCSPSPCSMRRRPLLLPHHKVPSVATRVCPSRALTVAS
jgi:hypothetical protein